MQFIVCANIIIAIGLWAETASAQAHVNPTCDGKPSVSRPTQGSPTAGIDNGFRFNEDCSTLYVRPPSFGTTTLIGIVPSANIQICPAVRSSTRQINQISTAMEDLTGTLTREGIDIVAVTAAIKNLGDARASLIETYDELTFKEGFQSNLLLQLPWTDLIAEYTRLNSQNYNVQPLPIEAGYLTYNLLTNATALSLSQQAPTALEIDVPGMTLGGLEDFNIIAPDQEDAVVFGSSLNGFVRLSLAGACVYFDEPSGTIKPETANEAEAAAGGSLVANYTYFYRLASEATYKMTFDAEVIGEIVLREYQRQNGTITAGSLSEELFAIQQEESFKIEINDPLGIIDTEALRTGFMANVRESFAHDLLSKFSDLTSTAELPEDKSSLELTGYRDEQRTANHCSRGGFLGLSKSCSTHVYTVKVPEEQLKERVKQIIADDFSVRYAEEGREVATILTADAIAMSTGLAVAQ